MLDKIKAVWALFQKGRAVANPGAWNSAAVAANSGTVLLVVLVGLARAWGADLPVSDDELQTIAGSAATLYFAAWRVYRVITREDRGLSPRRPSDGDGGEGPG
jgi:hypothetical protein